MSNTANIVLQFMQRYQNSLDTAIKNFIKKKNPNEKGKPIASGTDLDTMKKVGVFHIANDTIAGNIVHLPQAVSGKVLVQDNGNNGVVQFYIPNGYPKLYERVWGNNTWTAWKEYGTGGGGTDDYNSLSNQPKINNVTLSGNKTTGDLGVKLSDLTDVELDEPTANQVLKYNGETEKWVNGVDEGGGSASGTPNYIGTCTTEANVSAKAITVDSDFELTKGVIIGIKFSNSNTASNCTLNVNNTGAKSIYYNNAVYTGNAVKVCGCVDRYTYYTYDGNYWAWLSQGYDDDTTYSAMTDAEIQAGTSTTARLLTPKAFRANIDNKAWVGTCTTASDVATKAVTVDTGFLLVKGARIAVKFTNTNTASNCTLNVNSTGAKSIYYNNAVYTGTSSNICGYVNRYHYYLYDGTNWLWDGTSVELDSNYTPQALGFGYGTCTTAESTLLKEVTLSGYNLVPNGYVSVKFTNAVPANASMNINNKGSMLIYYKGALITANIIKAGDLATFIYDGASNYHLIGIDRTVEGGGVTYLTQTLTAGNTSVTFTNSAITNNALISVYTSVANLNYSSMTVGSGYIAITYPSQSTNVSVTLEIKNV